jgi:hypothetical protein
MNVWNLCRAVTLSGIAALFCNCSMNGPTASTNIESKKIDAVYGVSISNIQYGSVTAIPNQAIAGADIKLVANPQPGYKLASLTFHQGGVGDLNGGNQTQVNQNSQNVYLFEMPPGGAWITAQFVPVAAGEYSISLQTGDHGQVIDNTTSGTAGTKVTLYYSFDAGYALKATYPQLTGATWVPGSVGYEFTIDGTQNVTVTSVFEKPSSASSLIASAESAMNSSEYDVAFSYYEAAYQVDNTNPEAIFYSTIGQLLSIGIDPRVRVLLRNPGMVSSSTPGTINDLLDLGTNSSTNWLEAYTDPATGAVYDLPRLGAPASGFPSAFINFTVYQNNVGKRKLFDSLLFWNMIANDLDGFNDFFDDSLSYVFGQQFETACSRASTLPASATVSLNPTLEADLGLSQIYGSGNITVGRAELDVLISFLRSIKAGFEWCDSYDLRMDLRPFLVEVGDTDTINDLLAKILTNGNATIPKIIANDESYADLSRILPFRNLFLRVRNSAMMSAAQADLQVAVNTLNQSFGTLYSRLDSDAQAKYQWLQGDNGFLAQLKSALDSGGNIYFPAIPQYKSLFDAMAYQSAWITPSTANLGVNLGNLFTPGFMTLDKLINTDASDHAPQFYGFSGGTSAGPGTTISSYSAIDQYDTYSMELGQNFKSVFVKMKGIDAANYQWVSDLFPDFFPQPGSIATNPDAGLLEGEAKAIVRQLYFYYQQF